MYFCPASCYRMGCWIFLTLSKAPQPLNTKRGCYGQAFSGSFGSSQKIPAVAWRMRVRNKPGLHGFEEEGPDFVVGGDGYGEVRGVQLDNFIDVLPGVCTRNRPLTVFQVYIHRTGPISNYCVVNMVMLFPLTSKERIFLGFICHFFFICRNSASWSNRHPSSIPLLRRTDFPLSVNSFIALPFFV